MIRGLHICKPGNSPTVGQIKSFLLIETPSRSGDGTWTKIRSAPPDKGGAYYTIRSVEATGYEDDHGNVSFNLELEPANQPYQQAQQQPQQAQQQRFNGPGYQPQPRSQQTQPQKPQDMPEQFLTRCANLYCSALQVTATMVRDFAQRKGLEFAPEDLRQIATTLFLHAKDHGYVQFMSDKEKKDPF